MSTCRYCEATITWGCRAGQWVKVNADGSPHYCNSKRHLPDVDHHVGARIVGPLYKPSCGCATPPWEVCACSALMPA